MIEVTARTVSVSVCLLRPIQTEHVIRNRIGRFNAHVKRGQLENYLSFCVLRRNELAFRPINSIVFYTTEILFSGLFIFSGYICLRKHVISATGCCNVTQSQRYDCKDCQESTGCCKLYESCISCCMNPQNVRIQVWTQACGSYGILYTKGLIGLCSNSSWSGDWQMYWNFLRKISFY